MEWQLELYFDEFHYRDGSSISVGDVNNDGYLEIVVIDRAHKTEGNSSAIYVIGAGEAKKEWTVEHAYEWKAGEWDNTLITPYVEEGKIRLMSENALAWWNFDENLNEDNQVLDLTSNGINLSQDVADNQPLFVAGKFDNAFEFDGANDYLVAQHPFNYNEFTFTCWAKTYDNTARQHLIATYDNENSVNGWQLAFWDDGSLKFDHPDDTGLISATNLIENNKWYFVAASYDGSTAKIYLDGTQVASGTKSWTSSEDLILIGQRDFGNYMDGVIDEPRIFTRVLTGEEIVRLYNQSQPRDNISQGTWMSEKNLGDNYSIDNIQIKCSISSGESITAWVENSHDGSNWDNSGSINVLDGTNTYNVGTEGQYVRVQLILSTDNTTHSPSVDRFTVSYSELTANATPEVLNVYTPSSVNVNETFNVQIEVRDNDGLSDIDEVWLKIYENTLSQGDPDNARNHYTFKWVRGEGFSEVGPDNVDENHIVKASCSAGNDALTTDNWTFAVKLGKTASPNNSWNVYVSVTDNSNASDNSTFSNEFSVNLYLSVTLDDTALSFSGAPPSTVSASENPSVLTITSNQNFKIDVKLDNDPWVGGDISASDTKADKDGSEPYDLSLSTAYQTLYSSVGWGEAVEKSIYWFVSIPLETSEGDRTNKFWVRVIHV